MTKRLDKLEQALGTPETCPECGYEEGGEVILNVSWPEPGEKPQEEWCATCGRQITIVLTLDD